MSSLDVILPFLGPIAHLLDDPTITEVMVNQGGRAVFVEQAGIMRQMFDCAIGTDALTTAVECIARSLDEDISAERPILDSRLEDGSRVSAVFPPVSVDGVTLTIRRFGQRYSLEELVAGGTLTRGQADHLVDAIEADQTILISGATGTGKTTLLNAVAQSIPDGDRLILLEDISEISVQKSNLVRLEVRKAQTVGGVVIPGVSMADLVKTSLRHRPKRIIMGEIRGAEAFDLLQALNTGHQGSLTTIHANRAPDAMTRLVHCAAQAGTGLPYEALREAAYMAIDVVVQIEQRGGIRRVSEVWTVPDYQRAQIREIA